MCTGIGAGDVAGVNWLCGYCSKREELICDRVEGDDGIESLVMEWTKEGCLPSEFNTRYVHDVPNECVVPNLSISRCDQLRWSTICLPSGQCHIWKPRDGPWYCLEPGTLITQAWP